MFSFKNNYLSGLLSNILSKYIEELKPGELDVSLFAGQTVLKNLTLKPDALTSLKLPFTVIKGTVGSITINCSVCSMLFYPFTLEISDVYILASVNSSVMYEQNEECISKMVVKQESSKVVNYITGKALNIAAGVRYILKNIHIRLDHAFPEGYVSGGLFIPLIEVFTIDNNDNQVNQRVDLQHVQKKFVFHDLSLYLDNYKDTPQQVNLDNFQTEMQNLITDEGHTFVFKNKSLEGKFINNVQTQVSNKFDINLEEILLNLSQTQYKSVLLFMREFHKFNIRKYFAINGRPATFPQEENENTSGYWWLYVTHSAVLMNYRNNFKPDFALDFLKRRKECIQSIKSENCSKDSINKATEKYGQDFMRSVYKYSKHFNLLPKAKEVKQESSNDSTKISGNLGIDKLQVKLYDEQMESMLQLNKNNFGLTFKSFESANLDVSIKDIDFVTNKISYLKVGTPEQPAISSKVNTGLNEINVELALQDPTVVFEEKLALYFKEFFDVRVETVKNLFKLEPKKSKKKVDDTASQRAINIKGDINNLLVTSRTTINDISFGVNLISVKLLGGIIDANLGGIFARVNEFDILKSANIEVQYNNNHVTATVHDFPLVIDYVEIDDIMNHVQSVLNVVLGLTSSKKDLAITDESSNNNNDQAEADKANENVEEKNSTPLTLNCIVESFGFVFLHDRQETFDLAVNNIDVSRGEDLAFLVKSGPVTIHQMIVGGRDFLQMSGFAVKFDGSLNVDLNDLAVNLKQRPLNYIFTALGLFNDEDKPQPTQSDSTLPTDDQSTNSESTNASGEALLDDDDDDDDDEDKKLEKMILQDKLKRQETETLGETEKSKSFKFQSGTVMGVKKKEEEKKKEKKDSKPFIINVNINKGKIGMRERNYDFGTCGFGKCTVPLTIGGPNGVKFELFLDEVDFQSARPKDFTKFLMTPKLHFGFYDKTIFLDSPSLEMDFQFKFLMTFITFASGLYHVYEERGPKESENKEEAKEDTGLHLPDLKYKINLETIKLRGVTRYYEKANHYLNILLTSFVMDSDVKTVMNFTSKKIKLTTKDDDTMISIKEMNLPIEYVFDEDDMVTQVNVKPNFKSIKYDHNLAEELVVLDFLASFISENTVIPKEEMRRRRGPPNSLQQKKHKKLAFKSVSTNKIQVPQAQQGPKKDTSFQLVIDVKSDLIQVISTSYKETDIYLEGFNFYMDKDKKAIKVHRFYINIARHQKVEEVKTDKKAITDESKSSKSSSKSKSKSKQKVYINILKFDTPDNEDDFAFELANNSLILNLKNITLEYEYKVISQLLCIYSETRFIRYNFTDPKPANEESEEAKNEEESGGLVIKVGVSNVLILFPVDNYKLALKVDEVSFSNSKEGMSVIVGPIASFFKESPSAHLFHIDQLTYKSFSPEKNKNVLQVVAQPIDIVVDPAVIVSGILILDNVTSSFKKLHISNDNFKPDDVKVEEVKTVYDINLKGMTIRVNRGYTNVKALQDSMTLIILRIPENHIDLDQKRTFKFGSLEYINPNTSMPDLIIEPFEADLRMNLGNALYLDITTIKLNISFITVQKMISLLKEVYEKVVKKSITQSPPTITLVNDTCKDLIVSTGAITNKHTVPRYDKIAVKMDEISDNFTLYLNFPNKEAIVFQKSELFYPNFVDKVREFEATEKDKISVSWKRTSKGHKVRFSPITVVVNNTEFYIKFSAKSGVKDPKDLFQAQRFRTTEFDAPFKANQNYVLSIGGMGYSKQDFKLKEIKEKPVTVNCKWNDKDEVGIVVFAVRDPETYVLKIELNYAVTIINKLSLPVRVHIKGETYQADSGEEVGCSILDTGDNKCTLGVAIGNFPLHSTNNEISLKDGETSDVAVIADESNAKTIIAATIDRSYDMNPLRIILYSPVVFFNETGLDIGISDFSDEIVRYFTKDTKMLMAGSKYYFPNNVSDEKNQREKHSFKLYYQTDHVGAFEVNPNTLNIDQNLLIPLSGNTDFVHYADANMTYFAGNAFEAGNDMNGEESLYLPLHYNVRSNQPDSRTLIVTIFCQVLVLNELSFDIFLQPVIDKKPFGEKVKISGKSKEPVPIINSSTTYQFQVTTSDPSQEPVLVSFERPCHTNFFLKRPISSKKSKQKIIVAATNDSDVSQNSKLDYVNLRTEIVSTDFIATFTKGTFADSPCLILNQLSTQISYTQKKEKGYVSVSVEPNTSSILAFTYPFAKKSHIVYIDIKGTEISIDMDDPKEQKIRDPSKTKDETYIYINCFNLRGKQIILLKNQPYVPEIVPSTQYYLTSNGFQLSLISSQSKESILLSLGTTGAQYRVDSNTKTKSFSAYIDSFRIDNLSEKAIWPVVICSGKTSDKAHFVQAGVEMPIDESKSSLIQNFNVSIQPLLIAVDTSFIETLIEFGKLLESESKKAGLIKPLQSSTSRQLSSDSEIIIGNYDISDICVYLNFSKNDKVRLKEFFINLLPNIKDFEAKFSRKARTDYNGTISDLTNTLINEIKGEVLKAGTILSAFTKISAKQASSNRKLKFVEGVTVPNTRVRDARALPMKQILQFDRNEAFMQRTIRDEARSDEVVEIFLNTTDGKIIALTDDYIAVFRKPVSENDNPIFESIFNYKQINTIQAENGLLRFVISSNGAIVNCQVGDERKARMAGMYMKSMQNASDIGE